MEESCIMAEKSDLIWQRISRYQGLLEQARIRGDSAAEGRALDVLGHCYLDLEMWKAAFFD